MRRQRTEREIETLIVMVRNYCELRATYEQAVAEGRISAEEEALTSTCLKALDARIALLKSSSELDHERAHTPGKIIQLPQQLELRKAAR